MATNNRNSEIAQLIRDALQTEGVHEVPNDEVEKPYLHTGIDRFNGERYYEADVIGLILLKMFGYDKAAEILKLTLRSVAYNCYYPHDHLFPRVVMARMEDVAETIGLPLSIFRKMIRLHVEDRAADYKLGHNNRERKFTALEIADLLERGELDPMPFLSHEEQRELLTQIANGERLMTMGQIEQLVLKEQLELDTRVRVVVNNFFGERVVLGVKIAAFNVCGDGTVLAQCGPNNGFTEFPGDYPCLLQVDTCEEMEQALVNSVYYRSVYNHGVDPEDKNQNRPDLVSLAHAPIRSVVVVATRSDYEPSRGIPFLHGEYVVVEKDEEKVKIRGLHGSGEQILPVIYPCFIYREQVHADWF